jgi:hypothetical protein
MNNWLIYTFPTVVMIEMLLASIILAVGGKWGTALYWFLGAAISFTATFMIPNFG